MCGISTKPSVQELWREKGNMQMSLSSPRAVFAQFWDQQLREGQLVGRMLLQRLATGATGVKQARYIQVRGQRGTLRACALTQTFIPSSSKRYTLYITIFIEVCASKI